MIAWIPFSGGESMPSIYSHYRFGAQILPNLPADIRAVVSRHRRFYDAGLQGPDFFFFYKPFRSTEIAKLGHDFHIQTGREFFGRCCAGLDPNCPEETMAYLYGLLGHYCLDAHCHPLVHMLTDNTELGHNALESEFDRYLLALDGVKKPHIHGRSSMIRLQREDFPYLEPFYAPATAEDIRVGVQGFRLFTWLLTCNSPVYRALAKGVLRTLGPDREGLILPPAPDESCRRYNGVLLACFDAAAEHYPAMLEQLRDHIFQGEPLGNHFDPIFG